MQSAKCKIADENGLFSVECEEWSVELRVASLLLQLMKA